MFTQEEILTALQSGMDPQALAKDFTDKLNAAIKQDKEAKEAALKASKVKEDRIFALEQIVDNVADFVKKFYPDMYNEKMFNSINCEDLDKAIADAYNIPTIAVGEKLINDLLEEGGGSYTQKLWDKYFV